MHRCNASLVPTVLVMLALILPALPAQAAPRFTPPISLRAIDWRVDTTADLVDPRPGDGICGGGIWRGTCSLRAAIMESEARGGRQRIKLGADRYVLTRPFSRTPGAADGDLDITDETEIIGTSASQTIIDAGASWRPTEKRRVFTVEETGTLDLRRVTVTGGRAETGGGISNRGELTLAEVVVEGNEAAYRGGGLSNRGRVELTDSAVRGNGLEDVPTRGLRGNLFAGRGGGIDNLSADSSRPLDTVVRLTRSEVSDNEGNVGGGIYNDARLLMENVTVSGNRWGGGIANTRFSVSNNVTVSANESRDRDSRPADPASPREVAGGVTNYGSQSLFSLRNTIIAGNSAPNARGDSDDCSMDALSSDGYSIVGAGCGFRRNAATTAVGVDPGLVGLAQSGGLTRTHALRSASPAINAGYPYAPGGPAARACAGTDQRGVVRLVCDIGAHEVEVIVPDILSVDTRADGVDEAVGNGACAAVGGVCTLRAAVQESNILPGTQTITVPDGTIVLGEPGADEDAAATGDLDLTDDVVITGAGRDRTVIDADGLDRVLDIRRGVRADIADLTVRHGDAFSGGAVRTAGATTLQRVGVEDSRATYGAGIQVDDGSLSLVESRVTGNSAGFGGGGISSDGSASLSVEHSLVRDNAAGTSGGGIDSHGAFTLTTSTIDANRASRGAGITGRVQVTRSLFRDNVASANGGGLLTVGAGSRVVNTTFSGNRAGVGAGVSNSGTLELLHVTITDGDGGGVHTFGFTASTTLQGSIVAGNGGGDCQVRAITSAGHNLFGDGTCAHVASDLADVDPRLAPLADYGGPTLTHRLLDASPARSAASDAGVHMDQRGSSRPRGGGFDIGAFERP